MPHRRSNRAEMSGLRGWHWPQGRINSRWSGPIRWLHREIQRAFTSRKGGLTVSRGRGSAPGLSHHTAALPDASSLSEILCAMQHGTELNKILSTLHTDPTVAVADKYADGN